MIKFERHPEIALSVAEFATGRYKTCYSRDYLTGFAKVKAGEWEEREFLRSLFANDLWFLLVYGMGVEKAHHPFVVQICRNKEGGTKTGTLDVWAREHFKSLSITQGETLQYHFRNPEYCTGIFAYVRPAAKAFLRSLKILCEQSDLLKWCFPNVLWQRPEVEAPKWSLAIDTPVLTTDGWKAHGDLVPGDKIFGSKGQVITVVGNSGPMKDVECRRVVFADTELIASSEHLWPVECKSYKNHNLSGLYNGAIKTLPTDELPIHSKVKRMFPTPIIDMPAEKEAITVDPYIL